MQRVRWGVVLVLGTCGLGAAVAAAEPGSVLTTSGGRVGFEPSAGTVTLAQLDTVLAGGRRGWIAAAEPVPIWTVTLLDAQHKKHVVTARAGAATISTPAADRTVLEWTGVRPGKVHVVATITAKGADLQWELDVEATEPGYTLWDIVYPEIGPLALEGAVHSIAPYGWGVLHDNLLGYRHDRVYPSAAQALPFVAVADGKAGNAVNDFSARNSRSSDRSRIRENSDSTANGPNSHEFGYQDRSRRCTAGLYVGVHERHGYALSFFVGKRRDRNVASIGVRHDIEGMGLVQHYRLPYAVVVTPYAGDWYEAARHYRQAAQGTPWGSIPPLSQRQDIPPWLLETDLWYTGPCHDAQTAERILAFADYFDVPTSAHVYQWHQIPFDDHYPEYFPAKPGFAAAVKKVQAAGIAVMPYINGRLWDPATASWSANSAADACALDENGEKYVEVYGSKVPLSPMCPSTGLWQETVAGLVDRLVHEVGVRGVYIDQISAAAARRCFSASHGHAVGGGTHWIEGYRQLLARCRKTLPAGAALTTEENADPWNDQLDAWLLVNTRASGGRLVPLYPAVYGGRAISFGFQYIRAGDLENRYPFRLKMARAFVYGAQLGWVGPHLLDPPYTGEAKFLKTLCQARHAARDALQFGQLLPPVGLEGGGSVQWQMTAEETARPETQPAVLASAWRTPAGSCKVALTNVADERRTVMLSLDSRHVGAELVPDEQLTLRPTGGGPAVTLAPASPGWRGPLAIEAAGARVLEIVPPGPPPAGKKLP